MRITSRQQRVWIAAGLAFSAGLVAYSTWRALVGHSDVVGFHDTAAILWRTGELTQTEGWKFYLPGFAVIAMPFLAWPLWIVAPLMAVANLAAFWWTVRECGRLSGTQNLPPDSFHLRWTVPVLAVLVYAADSIVLGQFNLIVLALCVAAYRRSSRGADLSAGALTGLAAVIKLFPLVLLAYWLARGRWKAAITSAVSFALLAIVPSVAWLGWSNTIRAHEAWADQVKGAQYSTPASADSKADLSHLMFRRQTHQWMRHNNQSLAIVIRRLTTDTTGGMDLGRSVNLVSLTIPVAFGIYLGAAAALLAVLAWRTWRSRLAAPQPSVFAAWLTAVVAFVPVYWTHYFVLSLPAIACACEQTQRRGRRSAAFFLLVAWTAGELLAGSKPCRLVGLQCWLMLGLCLWAACATPDRKQPAS